MAAPYSITSSARASSDGGTSRPSALAVLRLMTSSILVRRLHRQVGRLLALEDAIDVARRAPVLIDRTPVRRTSARHRLDNSDMGRQRAAETARKRNNHDCEEIAVAARRHNHAAIGGASKYRKAAFDFRCIARANGG